MLKSWPNCQILNFQLMRNELQACSGNIFITIDEFLLRNSEHFEVDELNSFLVFDLTFKTS